MLGTGTTKRGTCKKKSTPINDPHSSKEVDASISYVYQLAMWKIKVIRSTMSPSHPFSPNCSSRTWHRKGPTLHRRTMIALSIIAFLVFANTAVIEAGSSTGISVELQQYQRNGHPSFVSLPQANNYITPLRKQSTDLNHLFRPAFHPIKSALILGFWSRKGTNDFDATSGCDGSQSKPILRVDYKQMDDNDYGSNLHEETQKGMVLYRSDQNDIEMNESSTATNGTNNSNRSILRSSLRSLRPLIIPPWILPFLSSENNDGVDIDDFNALLPTTMNEANSSMMLTIPSPKELDLYSNLSHCHDDNIIDAEIEVGQQDLDSSANELSTEQQEKNSNRRRFFRRQRRKDIPHEKAAMSKEEVTCPVIVSTIQELREAVLVNKIPLRDVGFRLPIYGIGSEVLRHRSGTHSNTTVGTGISLYNSNLSTSKREESTKNVQTVFQRHDPIINGTLSSLLTCANKARFNRNSTEYQHGIDLLSNHQVLSLIQERVQTNSTPGNRLSSDHSHLALVIEGGGMRGAVSAGMAAALSTLDLLDTFDSVHGSSAGAIIGAYLVSRQLCTDVYTDIMPAAGNRFASKKRSIINFGVDWLADIVSNYDEPSGEVESNEIVDSDAVCELVDEVPNSEIDGNTGNSSMWICEDDIQLSSVELAMRTMPTVMQRQNQWADDHYDGLLFESMDYLKSRTSSVVKKAITKPISLGMKYAGKALSPALSVIDAAASIGQYLRRKPGMNLTYVLDGIMDETHGLRPFDIEAFKANDKKQPLYIIASAVSNGGSGEMETLSFNSADGDYFGLSHDADKDININGGAKRSLFSRLWNAVKRSPLTLYSLVYKVLFSHESEYSETILPPGTNAIGGLVNKRKRIATPKKSQENFYEPTARINDEGKSGIFPCLEASMLVPGIGNAPINVIRSRNRKFIETNKKFPRFLSRSSALLEKQKKEQSHMCYDAFCYEPIPYRSAVEKAGATHVLALRSRPDGCVVETRQHLYERVVGPIYFRKYGMNNVAKLFSSGGSQYRYIEDILTLNEGLVHGISTGGNETRSLGVKIPPTKLLFGTETDEQVSIDEWKYAHLLPITLPYGTPELPTLSQDREEVLKAVRHGYAAAFDVLAPIAGLPFDSKTISGEKVAEILFPGEDDDIDILNRPVKIKSSYIGNGDNGEVIKELKKRERFVTWITGKREATRKAQEEVASHPQGVLAKMIQRRSSTYHESDQYVDASNTLEWLETEALLAALPGFRDGKLDHIADTLLAKDERKKES